MLRAHSAAERARAPRAPLPAGAALSCAALRVALPGRGDGGRLLVRDLELMLPAEGRLLVVGPNGSGKVSCVFYLPLHFK